MSASACSDRLTNRAFSHHHRSTSGSKGLGPDTLDGAVSPALARKAGRERPRGCGSHCANGLVPTGASNMLGCHRPCTAQTASCTVLRRCSRATSIHRLQLEPCKSSARSSLGGTMIGQSRVNASGLQITGTSAGNPFVLRRRQIKRAASFQLYCPRFYWRGRRDLNPRPPA